METKRRNNSKRSDTIPVTTAKCLHHPTHPPHLPLTPSKNHSLKTEAAEESKNFGMTCKVEEKKLSPSQMSVVDRGPPGVRRVKGQ